MHSRSSQPERGKGTEGLGGGGRGGGDSPLGAAVVTLPQSMVVGTHKQQAGQVECNDARK